jgi:hypothetical protein
MAHVLRCPEVLASGRLIWMGDVRAFFENFGDNIMSTVRNSLITGILLFAAGCCGAAQAQEAFQARIDELGGKIYRTGRPGSMTITENTAQEFIDRFSGSERFAGEATKKETAARAVEGRSVTQFMANSDSPMTTTPAGSLAQDYIDRTSSHSIYHY